MPGPDDHRPIVVMESFRPNERTNPYLLLLLRALQAEVHATDVSVRTFSRRDALLGRYDVLHLHWPEVLLEGRNRSRSAAKAAIFLCVLVVARLRRRRLVRTLHNVTPHEQRPFAERFVLDLTDRWTHEWITLSATADPPGVSPTTTVIPHGHYRDWYPPATTPDSAVDGRVLFFGLVRRYKGVDELIDTFRSTSGPGLTLRIVGKCDEPDLTAMIEDAVTIDDRITASLDFASEEQLTEEISAARLVVLPYRSILNSGSVLLALSLDRPVLVPSTPSMDELAREVGIDWVRTYDSPLTAETISIALAQVTPAGERPDLAARDWDHLAAAHVAVFLHAARG